jgi:hypothetical protein
MKVLGAEIKSFLGMSLDFIRIGTLSGSDLIGFGLYQNWVIFN